MQPLHRGVAVAAERTVAEQGHLYRPEAPARPLRNVFRQAFRRQPDTEPLVQPMRLESARHQLIGEIDVLADRAVREAADFLETVAPHDKRGADAEGAAPSILGRLEDV